MQFKIYKIVSVSKVKNGGIFLINFINLIDFGKKMEYDLG